MGTNNILERTKLFESVFQKHGSDKFEHGYAKYYAQYLPENPRSILEIGVKQGASIRAWKELFPDAFICGYDLFNEFPIPKIEGVLFVKGNQRDVERLTDIGAMDFEVVIDDGSHNARGQMISFYTLAKKGMLYFIEDVHCNEEEFYSQGLPSHFRAINMLSFWNEPVDSLSNKSKLMFLS